MLHVLNSVNNARVILLDRSFCYTEVLSNLDICDITGGPEPKLNGVIAGSTELYYRCDMA